MDGYRRKLNSYLSSVLEPTLKLDQKGVAEWSAKEDGSGSLDDDLAKKMRRWHEGRASAFTFAINEFKELFGEDLK